MLNVFYAGDVPFIYFDSEDGGRILAAERIQSIVPDFKGVGSLAFLVDGDGKAIKIQMNPSQVHEYLRDDD